MPAITELKVVHIPCDGSSICLKDIALIDVGPGNADKDGYKDFEKKFGHIPDIPSLKGPKRFSWSHRYLVEFPNAAVNYWDEKWQGHHMMYMCLENVAGLPPNERLKTLFRSGAKGRAAQTTPRPVYGDALVFKMESESKDHESERARYIHMDPEFGSYASMESTTDAGELHMGYANVILWKLLMRATGSR